MHPGKNNRPVVTGKPLEIGGSLGRDDATAMGCLFATEQFLSIVSVSGLESLRGAYVAVQGYGQVGAAAARLMQQAGAIIVAVSDSQGGIADINGGGLDISIVDTWKREHGTVVGVPETRTITNDDLLEMECDILVPAALGNQITRQNVERVKARLVVEAANRPVTPEADIVLAHRGIHLIPDILANAGGVTVSYFEWVQNIENESWDLEVVNNRLRKKMLQATEAVVERWLTLGTKEESDGQPPIDLRTAALVVAIERMAHITLKRGIWP